MLEQIRSELQPYKATLIAVSKTKSPEEIMEIYQRGQRIFGENRVEELVQKNPLLPADIEWHMVGHLQSKKVKKIAAFIHCIQSVDSFKLLMEINKQALRHNRIIHCLLQIKIASEESKYGLKPSGMAEFLGEYFASELKNIRICGLMGMGSFTSDQEQIQSEFKLLSQTFKNTRDNFFPSNKMFKHISMGMSGDYKLALAEGSTMVRIGTLIFGPRPCMLKK